jgi:hypothetical protein
VERYSFLFLQSCCCVKLAAAAVSCQFDHSG